MRPASLKLSLLCFWLGVGSVWAADTWLPTLGNTEFATLLRLRSKWYELTPRLELIAHSDPHPFATVAVSYARGGLRVSVDGEVLRLAGNDSPSESNLGKLPLPLREFENYCALTENGQLYCKQSRTDSPQDGYHYELVDTLGLDDLHGKIRDLSGSPDHACAVTSAGKIYCWGSNYAGKLGLGGFPFAQLPSEGGDWSVVAATPPLPFPTKAVSDNGKTFIAVSVWGNTSCALSNEPTNNLYCWGRVLPKDDLYYSLDEMQRATFATPSRLDLSGIPGNRLVGLQTYGDGGFGWTVDNTLVRWGSFKEDPRELVSSRRLTTLLKFPGAASIQAAGYLHGEICVFAEQLQCTLTAYLDRKEWGWRKPL